MGVPAEMFPEASTSTREKEKPEASESTSDAVSWPLRVRALPEASVAPSRAERSVVYVAVGLSFLPAI